MSKSTVLNDAIALDEKDLRERIQEERLRYAKMKHMHAVTPLESPVILRRLRRDIARMVFALSLKQKAK